MMPAPARSCGIFIPCRGRVNSVTKPGQGDSAKNRSGVNNWGFSLTVDAERGIVYTVFGGPNTNFWGGDRKGNDLFANSRRRHRCRNRKNEVVFPGGASRPVGFRSARAAHVDGCNGEREEDSHSGADREDRLPVHSGSRDGQAGIRHRREAGARKQSAGRAEFADAARAGEAAAACRA